MAKHDFELTHAPNVAPEWTEAFIVEARLRDLTGAQIGDALAEVNAHVVDSGQSARDAFGDPRAYAAELATSAAPVVEGHMARTLVPVGLQVVGMVLGLSAAAHLGSGEPFELGWGLLSSLLFILLVIAAMGLWSASFLRIMTEKVWVLGVFVLVGTAAIIGAAFLPGVVATFPVGWAIGVAVLFLAVGTFLHVGPWKDAVAADEIVGPDGTKARSARGAAWVSVLMVPAATVVLGVVFALLG